MATATATQIRLETLESLRPVSDETPASTGPSSFISLHDGRTLEPPPEETANLTTAVPDGGYGWVIVFCCSVITFNLNGWVGSWGVIQAHLLETTLATVSTATLTYVGSLSVALSVALGTVSIRVTHRIGSRWASILGVSLLGIGQIIAGSVTHSVGGLFGTAGATTGLGVTLIYSTANNLPIQYFSARLGTANGLVKLGGGIGATVMAIGVEYLIQEVGLPWTLRIFGFITLATGIPAGIFNKDRKFGRRVTSMELSMFRNLSYTTMCIAAAIGTFTLFVPPFFLPLVARSIGLPSATGAGLVAGFNACTAVGRLTSGPLCDKLGATNVFLVTMIVAAASMLAIWPISSNLPLLAAFAVLNGWSNGAFFVAAPTVAARMFGPARGAVAVTQSITWWTFGYLMGAPIAGYLVQATGADKSDSLDPYRPAIFYAGGLAAVSAFFVLLARLSMGRKLFTRV